MISSSDSIPSSDTGGRPIAYAHFGGGKDGASPPKTLISGRAPLEKRSRWGAGRHGGEESRHRHRHRRFEVVKGERRSAIRHDDWRGRRAAWRRLARRGWIVETDTELQRKKSRREDDTDDDELDEEETDGTQKSNVTPPPPPVCSINKVAKKPNDASTSNKNHKKIDGTIQVISDDEMETTFKGEEEARLKVEKIKEGRSDSKVATDGNKVSINFVGRFKKNGPVFDEGDSFQFELGAGKVVRGLDMGINGMKVGEEREFTIPPSLGYGGIKQENIPANSWLFYKIKLLEVVEETKRTKKGRTDA